MNPRIDMSEWVIHFVHRRAPEVDPRQVFSDSDDGEPTPSFYHADPKLNERFSNWDWLDDQYLIEPDASPIQVLRKILDDGHIRCGWSFRPPHPGKKGPTRATIYGPRAACCFTEMPLYALLQYATARKEDRVATYGLALRRQEFFQAGGRPVIYGLSTKHVEVGDNVWPRLLHQDCGIGHNEQYRYVAMNLSPDSNIDWSHEREWRWVDVKDQYGVPGLPLWLEDEPALFSKILIFVPTEEEADGILDHLKSLHDTGGSEFDVPYKREVIRNAAVFSIDAAFSKLGHGAAHIVRIDDLPLKTFSKFQIPIPSPELKESAQLALKEARAAAVAAVAAFGSTPEGKNIHEKGAFGGAFVQVLEPQADITQALLELEEAFPRGRTYAIHQTSGGSPYIDEARIAAEAAANVLRKHFPGVAFYVETWLD